MSKTAGGRSDYDAWKEVHQQLINAVLIAKDAISIQLAQRRFWLTEFAANVTPEGKLTPQSVWKRPIKKRTKAAVASSPGTAKVPGKKKRQRKADSNSGKRSPVPKSTAAQGKKKGAVVAVASPVENDVDDEEMDDADDDDDDMEEDVEEPTKPKLRLSLHLKPSSQQDVEEEDDEETEEEEEEEEDEDDKSQEDSFLGNPSSPGPSMFPSFYTQQQQQPPRGHGTMPPEPFATAEEQDDSDEDTEEDDY